MFTPTLRALSRWNGAQYTLLNSLDGSTMASGTMSDGASATAELCIPAGAACHPFKVSAGDFPDEIAWVIAENGGDVVEAPSASAEDVRPPEPALLEGDGRSGASGGGGVTHRTGDAQATAWL